MSPELACPIVKHPIQPVCVVWLTGAAAAPRARMHRKLRGSDRRNGRPPRGSSPWRALHARQPWKEAEQQLKRMAAGREAVGA